MLRSAKRLSLVAQTVAILKEHLASGLGGDRLPSERELSTQLGVSRMTLRAALTRLTDEGLIRGGKGKRHQIAGFEPHTAPIPSERNVVILSPISLQAVDPRVLFWINDLREALSKENYKLDFLKAHNCYTESPNRALEELARQHHPVAWLLFLSTHPIQEWFSKRGLPAVIPGSRYGDVRLPSVDVDYRAACRHAAGCFHARGHQRIVLLNPHSMAAGDIESELGFCEAGEAKGSGLETIVSHHDGTVRGICKRLDSLLASKRKPTGFLISRPSHALTTMTHLLRKGLCFPKDAALIARDHDSFLEYVVPSVARYQVNPELFAHKISRVVLEMASGGDIRARDYRIIPELISGETLE